MNTDKDRKKSTHPANRVLNWQVRKDIKESFQNFETNIEQITSVSRLLGKYNK